jgi:hypothetical protein
MSRAELRVVQTGFIQAELAIDCEAHFRGVVILLAVILPPANRAQLQSAGCIESSISTTRATKTHFNCRTHAEMDGAKTRGITAKRLQTAILTLPLSLFGPDERVGCHRS